jgi:hypothetical protein
MTNKQKIFAAALLLAASLPGYGGVTISPLSDGTLKAVVSSNTSGQLNSVVSQAIEDYNTSNATQYTVSNISSLKVSGSLSYWMFDLSNLNTSMLTGDLGDDLSFIWTLRASLTDLDLADVTMTPSMSTGDDSIDSTLSLILQALNVIPPYAFWRGVDIDTDLLPDASNRITKQGMYNLKSVKLPSALIGLDAEMVAQVATLIKDYLVNNNIEDETLKSMLNTIADTILTADNVDFFGGIGDYAFAYATSLESVTIPGRGQLKIGSLAYEGVRTIGKKAFYHDDALTSVTFGQTRAYSLFGDYVSNFRKIGEKAFAYSGLTSIEIPAETETISSQAFAGCSSLSSVNVKYGAIPVNNTTKKSISLASIGSSAFKSCTALTSFTYDSADIPLQTIGESAFKGCTSLTGIVLPAALDSLANEAFRNCTNLNFFVIDGQEGELTLGSKILMNTPAMHADNGGILMVRRLIPPTGTSVADNKRNATFISMGYTDDSSVLPKYLSPVNQKDETLQISLPFFTNDYDAEASTRYQLLTGRALTSFSSNVSANDVKSAYAQSSLWLELANMPGSSASQIIDNNTPFAVNDRTVTIMKDNAKVEVYQISGSKTVSGVYSSSDSINLPSGIYVIVVDGVSYKMSIN